MTKYFEERNKFRKEDTPISISGEEWTQDPKREYTCKWCYRVMQRLVDRNNSNESYYCSFCSVELLPEETRLKEQVKVPQGVNKVPLVTNKFLEPGLKRKKNEPRGSFKVLRDRGMNIVNYKETGWRREKEDE